MLVLKLALFVSLVTSFGCGNDGSDGEMSDNATPRWKKGGDTSSDSAHGTPTLGNAVPVSELQANVYDLPASEQKFVVDPKLTNIIFENVKLDPKTLVTPSAALVSSAGSVGSHTFDTAKLGALAGALKKGRVLLVPGRVLGKVTSVTSDAGKTIVTTEFAALTDAFVDLKMGWDADLTVQKSNLAAFVMPDGRQFPLPDPVQYASNGVPFSGPMEWSLTDGKLTYKVKLDAQPNHIDTTIQVTRKLSTTGGMTYTGKLRIKPISVRGSGSIKGGKTKNIDLQQKNLGGELELSVAVAGGGTSEIKKDLPMPLFKWIVMVGPIPVVITAKARVVGRATLPNKGSALASAKYSFSGEAGFKFDGSKVHVTAAFPKKVIKTNDKFTATGFIGQMVDAQFGVAFPVLGMAMFDSFFMPELTPGAQLGVSLTWGPVCQRGYLQFSLKASYDFKVFGVSLSQAKTTLFTERKDSKDKDCKKK